MVLDLFSNFDSQSGSGMGYMLYWFLSLYFFLMVVSSSSYWMSSNWIEALVIGLHKFDPGKMHSSQPFSDPGFSSLICSSWLVVGFMGFLSLLPYYDDLAREPSFIYSVTMTLWWYALASYTLSSPINLFYGVLTTSKNVLYFFIMLILESVSWATRGFTFGARFLVTGTVGSMGSFFLCSMMIDSSNVLSYFMLGALAFFWGIYEILVVSFQSYLIGLLGIIFCSPHPMMPSGRRNS
uniref:ATP synthase F0 subunit 6 n=1 Tax=Acanthocardia tuberculata TaxID=385555 RepID=Q06SA0_ACATU|nr:ATP synthase F0 subunit 6 [Acanthocardia tuberculata]ABF60138.1 ATP synthase F0 subunit 6 [Acanthocardia tuberculata]